MNDYRVVNVVNDYGVLYDNDYRVPYTMNESQ